MAIAVHGVAQRHALPGCSEALSLLGQSRFAQCAKRHRGPVVLSAKKRGSPKRNPLIVLGADYWNLIKKGRI
jgi:hypothetical protein